MDSCVMRKVAIGTGAAASCVLLASHIFIMRRVEAAYDAKFSLWLWIRYAMYTKKFDLIWRMLTKRWRALPDFYVLGEQKAGTTALTDILAAFPSHFVGASFCWEKGKPPFGWFDGKEAQFFNGFYGKSVACSGVANFPFCFPLKWACQGRLVYDASPHNLFMPHVAARIAEATPDAKLIIVTRDPTARAFSQYQMYKRFYQQIKAFESCMGSEWTFEKLLAVAEDPKTAKAMEDLANIAPGDPLPDNILKLLHPASVIARGKYAENIARYLDYFSADRILILDINELSEENSPATLCRVCKFLEMENADELVYQGRAGYSLSNKGSGNVGGYSEKMSAETRQRLTDLFATHEVVRKKLAEGNLDFSADAIRNALKK